MTQLRENTQSTKDNIREITRREKTERTPARTPKRTLESALESTPERTQETRESTREKNQGTPRKSSENTQSILRER